MFLEAERVALDPFWKAKATEARKGKLPKGVTLGEGGFTVGDSFFPFGSSFETLESLKRAYKAVGLTSERDVSFPAGEKLPPSLWKELKTKESKERLLMDFSLRKAKERRLGVWKAKMFFKTILLGIQLRQLLPQDFSLKDGAISRIDNLEYDDASEGFLFLRPLSGSLGTSKSQKVGDELRRATERWAKGFATRRVVPNT